MATVKFTSPKGIAQYPWLTKADTKFDAEGKFKTGLIVDVEAAQPLIDVIEKQIMATARELVEEAAAKGKKLALDKVAAKLKRPYAEDEEDDSKIVFRLSQNQIVQGKTISLKFFDANRKPIPLDKVPAIYGGSIIRISGGARPYMKGANKGVTLDIYAVQLIQLAEGTSGNDDYGFEEEDGYTANHEDHGFTEEPEGFDGGADDYDEEF